MMYILNNPKNREVIKNWSEDINLLTTHNRTEVYWKKETWEKVLNDKEKRELIIQTQCKWLKSIPEDLIDMELLKDILEQESFKGFPFPVNEKFWKSANFCFDVLKKTTEYIKEIPEKHWHNKYFVLEVLRAIDDKKIADLNTMGRLPDYMRKFFNAYEINQDYSQFFQAYVMNEEIDSKPVMKKKKI